MKKLSESRVQNKLRALGRKTPSVLMELCEVNGDVNVPGGQGYMWARATKRDIPVPVLNLYSSAQPGQQVLIGEDPASPGVRQVIGARIYPGDKLRFNPKIAAHKNHHARFGVDPLFIETKQITNCLAYNGGGLKVKVYPGVAQVGTQYVQCGWQTLDLTSHVPTSGIRFVLIQIDGAGAASAKAGAEFALADYNLAYIPARDGSNYICAAVRLHAGQTTIKNGYTDPDLIDLRFLNSGGSGGGGVLAVAHVRYTPSTGTYVSYPATYAGLVSALAAAAAGDIIYIALGDYTGALTIPAAVAVSGQGQKETRIYGKITAGAGCDLRHLGVHITGTSAGALVGIECAGNGLVILDDALVNVDNAGTGQAYDVTLTGGASTALVVANGSYLKATTASGNGRAVYSAVTNAGAAFMRCSLISTGGTVAATWAIAEGVDYSLGGVIYDTGYTPAGATYINGDRAAIDHTHTESQIADLDHDAVKLQGRAIASAAPANGQMLRWNQSASQWEPGGVDAAGIDGWAPAGETWTYASASTVTAPGDVRTKYPVGTKVKLVQAGAQKYFYVARVAYTADVTTLTLIAGSDYSLTNTAITDNAFSYVGTPRGFPVYFAYTPTAIGLTTPVYNAQFGRFTMQGGWFVCSGRVDISSWTAQTGYMRISLPIGAAGIYMPGAGSYFRADGGANVGPTMTVIVDGYIGFLTANAGDGVSWDASSRTVLEYSILYLLA